MAPKLTLVEAFDGLDSSAIVVLERLRRWLELRPDLKLTFGSHRDEKGCLYSAVGVSWSYEKAPPEMAGTWASLSDVEHTAWPLHRALNAAARLFEVAERKGSAP